MNGRGQESIVTLVGAWALVINIVTAKVRRLRPHTYALARTPRWNLNRTGAPDARCCCSTDVTTAADRARACSCDGAGSYFLGRWSGSWTRLQYCSSWLASPSASSAASTSPSSGGMPGTSQLKCPTSSMPVSKHACTQPAQ